MNTSKEQCYWMALLSQMFKFEKKTPANSESRGFYGTKRETQLSSRKKSGGDDRRDRQPMSAEKISKKTQVTCLDHPKG
jgi:hypothetical protein